MIRNEQKILSDEIQIDLKIASAFLPSLDNKTMTELSILWLVAFCISAKATAIDDASFIKAIGIPQATGFTAVLSVKQNLYTASQQLTSIKVWDVSSDKLIKEIVGHSSPVLCLAQGLFNGEAILVSGDQSATVVIRRESSHQVIRTIKTNHAFEINSIVVDSSNGCIFTGSKDGTIKQWNINDGSLMKTLSAHSGGVQWLTIDEKGFLISSGWDYQVKIWKIQGGLLVRSFKNAVAGQVTTGNSSLWFGSTGGNILQYNLNTGELQQTLVGQKQLVLSLIWKNGFLYSGSVDGLIKMWNIATGRVVRNLIGHTDAVRALTFQESDFLISASDDKTLLQWFAGECSPLETLQNGQCLCTTASCTTSSTGLSQFTVNVISGSILGAAFLGAVGGLVFKRARVMGKDKKSQMPPKEASRECPKHGESKHCSPHVVIWEQSNSNVAPSRHSVFLPSMDSINSHFSYKVTMDSKPSLQSIADEAEDSVIVAPFKQSISGTKASQEKRQVSF